MPLTPQQLKEWIENEKCTCGDIPDHVLVSKVKSLLSDLCDAFVENGRKTLSDDEFLAVEHLAASFKEALK